MATRFGEGTGPIPRERAPFMRQDVFRRMVQIGKSALDPVTSAGIQNRAQQEAQRTGVDPTTLAQIATAGLVLNRVLQEVDKTLRPLAVERGLEGTAQLPIADMPGWCVDVLRACGALPPDPAEAKEPEEESLETRAARSGLVIAS